MQENPEIFDYAIQLVSLFVGIVLCYLTYVLAQETKLLRKISSSPLITVTLEQNEWLFSHFDMVVENSGNAAAFDISIKLSFEGSVENCDSLPEAIIKGASVMRPGQILRSHIGDFEEIRSTKFIFDVEWHLDAKKDKRETARYIADLADFAGMRRLGDAEPLVVIAKQLENIRTDWQYVASGSRKIKTETFSGRDRKKERVALEAQREKKIASRKQS
ncbi:MAG: hypothetical protein AAF371_17685 [Pseudomonadota bacterium]